MKYTFKAGDKVKCIDPIGFLIKNKIYTVRVNDAGFLFLEESNSPSHHYASNRFRLEEQTLEEQIKVAKDLIGKTVKFGKRNVKVDNVVVFIKGVNDKRSSDLINEVLEKKDWCVGLCFGIETIPLKDAVIISNILIENVGDYKATVYKDYVQVGCQKIDKDKVEEIVNAFKALEQA